MYRLPLNGHMAAMEENFRSQSFSAAFRTSHTNLRCINHFVVLERIKVIFDVNWGTFLGNAGPKERIGSCRRLEIEVNINLHRIVFEKSYRVRFRLRRHRCRGSAETGRHGALTKI